MNEITILNLLFKNDKNSPIIEKIDYNINYDKNYEYSYNDNEYEFQDDMKKFLTQKVDKENFLKNNYIQKEKNDNKNNKNNFKIINEKNLYKKIINLDEEYYKYNQKITHDLFAINLHEVLRIPYQPQIRKNIYNKNKNFNNYNFNYNKRENNFNRSKNNFHKRNNSYNNYHNNNDFNFNPFSNYSKKRNKSSHKKYY